MNASVFENQKRVALLQPNLAHKYCDHGTLFANIGDWNMNCRSIYCNNQPHVYRKLLVAPYCEQTATLAWLFSLTTMLRHAVMATACFKLDDVILKKSHADWTRCCIIVLAADFMEATTGASAVPDNVWNMTLHNSRVLQCDAMFI